MFGVDYTIAVVFFTVLAFYLLLIIPVSSRNFDSNRLARKDEYFGRSFSYVILIACLGFHIFWTYTAIQSESTVSVYNLAALVLLNISLIPFFFHQTYFFGSMSAAIALGKTQYVRNTTPQHLNVGEIPSVTVIIPCRNEPFDALKLTFDSAMSLKYPDNKVNFIVCDNSDINHKDYLKIKNYVESFSNTSRKAQFIHRDGTEGFKAGNLDLALKSVKSDLALFLDVDSTVGENTLLDSISDFAQDKKLGFLQFFNIPTNSNTGLMAGVSSWLLAYWKYREFFRGTFGGWSFFQGHNTLWRTELLHNISPLAEKLWGEAMLVEDAFMTIKSNKLGFYGKNKWVPCGFWVPGSLKELESMFVRWSYGSFQIIFLEVKFLLMSGRKKLTLSEYVDVIYHFLSFSIQSFTPIIILLLGISDPAKFFLTIIYLSSTYLFVFLTYALKKDFRKMSDAGFSSFLMSVLVLMPFVTWCSLKGTFQFITRRRQKWIPTSKANQKSVHNPSWFGIVKLHSVALLIALLCLAFTFEEIITAQNPFLMSIIMLPIFLYAMGTILSVAFFGKSKMEYPDDIKESTTINKFINAHIGTRTSNVLIVQETLPSKEILSNENLSKEHKPTRNTKMQSLECQLESET